MAIMIALTMLRYYEIQSFKNKSREYSIVLDKKSSQVSSIKSFLQDLTFQEVKDEEFDGKYRFIIKCPPDRFKNIMNKINEEFE